eukprot:CAMPEP_0206005800 /NCGR_PEP_ID=MMETSP1464-20131121/4800_1 /ASSEMBLY_ACC=CAM_ASM_001124 /TAXON_ID=119497 /ORGANISM="Exanthemachrysis gayraliae, Strain RCC1523" /LENGTH=432 /DNA_ID=CAMNT_0053379259 /DNA_START=57 /DNA_END=1355 /DNA_ORIENTATION=+
MSFAPSAPWSRLSLCVLMLAFKAGCAAPETSFHHAMAQLTPFARSPTEFKLQVGFAKASEDSERPLYSDGDIRLMLRAVHVMQRLLDFGLYSRSPGDRHFIGTASCMAKLRRPALEVAHGILHGAYVQQWRKDIRMPHTQECKRRNMLASMVGTELEELVFMATGLHATGPFTACLHAETLFLRAQKTEAQFTNATHAARLDGYKPYASPYMMFCDEIEETVGGDMALGGNWKRRGPSHFEVLEALAEELGDPQAVAWARSARDLTRAFFLSTDVHARELYLEVSPRDQHQVHSSVKFGPGVEPAIVHRLQLLTNVTGGEAAVAPPYVAAGGGPAVLQGIQIKRASCRALHQGKLSFHDFLASHVDMRTALQRACPAAVVKTDHATGKPLPAAVPVHAVAVGTMRRKLEAESNSARHVDAVINSNWRETFKA